MLANNILPNCDFVLPDIRGLGDRDSPTAVAKTQFEVLRRFQESQLGLVRTGGLAGPVPPHQAAAAALTSSSVTAEIMRMATTVQDHDNGDVTGSGQFSLSFHSVLAAFLFHRFRF